MSQRHNFRIGPVGMLPPAIKNLIFANGIIYLMTVLNGGVGSFLISNFALIPSDIIYNFKIWQLVTYMFLHDPFGIWHILFNMIFLWMFGADLEREWGTKEFLKYYFITGVGAGLINLILSPAITIGASGAIYGVMLAYALRYPDNMIYVYFLFPVKIKYFMGFLILVQFFSTFSPYSDGVAHAAHLGGIIVGYVYLKYWHLFFKVKNSVKNIFGSKSDKPNMKFTQGGQDKTEYYRRTIDELLDKINRVGYLNLTDEEKKLLEEGSKYLREHDKENFN